MAAIELKARDAVAKAEATVGSAYFYTDLQQVTKDIQTQVMTTSSTGGPTTQLSSSEVAASIENPAATSISSLVNSNITASTQGGINSSTALNQSRSSTPATGSVESILTDDLTGSIQIETSFSITGVSSSPVGTQSTKATSTGNSGAAPIRFTSGHHSCKFQMLLGVMLLLPILM
ncbi:DEBR0S5_01596g1_1 [Brettanomyces bruxellensis]|uniref:DEBR0S5_01596g1_1 n=1 Tax=Dekkera bruxellensis TaxID=5007 RepID=A0A7D9D0T6_DEKBR|nr:DEBR0S5_01596g1_1 [Brettanomyces bruxellensis]